MRPGVVAAFALCVAACEEPAGPEPALTGFTDVTATAGLAYRQRDASTCPTTDVRVCAASLHSGGGAVGDYDSDGAPDIVVTRLDAPGLLFRNRGDGTFEEASARAGLVIAPGGNGAAWGDVDGDGDLDLLVSSMGGSALELHVNAGDGTFTEEAEARGLALYDGILHTGSSVAFGDFDRDGWLDVHTTEWRAPVATGPDHSRLFRNLGDVAPGHFVDVTDAAGTALRTGERPGGWSFTSAFSDLDADGSPDLAVAADYGASRLFWNRGDGTFEDGTAAAGVGTDENGMGSAIADFDGDGRLDWFVTGIFELHRPLNGSGNRLYRNLGGRRFEDVTDRAGVRDGAWGWGAVALDFDLDGDLDLAMTNGFPSSRFAADPTKLWRNFGDGRFEDVSARAGITDTGQGRALLLLDYDRDGDEDLFVVNGGGSPVLYRNDADGARAWLRVRAHAKRGGTPALGAQVTVRVQPAGSVAIREVAAGGCYLGQSEQVAHFGLGDAGTVAEVRVRWPSGREAVLNDVPTRQTIDVTEPD